MSIRIHIKHEKDILSFGIRTVTKDTISLQRILWGRGADGQFEKSAFGKDQAVDEAGQCSAGKTCPVYWGKAAECGSSGAG